MAARADPPPQTTCKQCDGTGKLTTRECEACAGTGECECSCGDEHDCGVCDGKKLIKIEGSPEACKDCDGSGKTVQTTSIPVGQAWLSDAYLALIATLPEAELARPTGSTEAVPFRFKGGVGYIMPMRPPFQPNQGDQHGNPSQ